MHNFNTLTEAIVDCEASRSTGITYVTGLNSEQYYSYWDLRQRSLRLLGFLRNNGIDDFREVVIFTKENKYLVECFFASVFGGKIAAPVSGSNKLENIKKLELIVGKMTDPLVAVEAGLEQAIFSYTDQRPASPLARAKIVAIEEDTYLSCEQADIAKVDSSDIAFIQFSSGSTTNPKGVTLTHNNVLSNVNSICKNSKFHEHEVMVSWMPLTHDMGMIGSLISMVVFKFPTHIISTELFSRRPFIWLDVCNRKRATITMSPNFGYKHVLKYVDEEKLKGMDFSSIRRIYNGAEPVSIALCHEFMERMKPYGLNPDSMLMVYGLAEATLSVTMGEILAPFDQVKVKRSSLDNGNQVEYVESPDEDGLAIPSVGKSVLNCQIRIGQPESGLPLQPYQIGEIHISSTGVTSGYYNDPEITEQLFTHDGWMKTGDLGFIDDNRQLFITGRLKELIIINGRNIYPHDIDRHLHEQGILELGKIACTRISNEDGSSDGFAVFLAIKNNAALYQELKGRTIRILSEDYGIAPTAVIPVSSIPKTTSGKIKRVELENRYKSGEFKALLSSESEPDAALKREKRPSWYSETEKQLLAAMQALMKSRPIDPNDNFMELGIESIMLAQFHAFIEERYPNTVHVMDLYEWPNISALAKLIERRLQLQPVSA